MAAPVYPTYTVDGVAMDSHGWYLTPATRHRPLPGAKAVKVEVPGRAGELPIVGLDVETTTLPLGLRVTALRPDGSEGDLLELETNLEALFSVFGVRHRMLDVRHIPAPGMVRQADATVLSASDPEYDVANRRATVTVVLTIPGVYWRDPREVTWAGLLPGVGQAVTELAGGTAPVTDAIIRFTGPATNPAMRDEVSGGTVAGALALAAGQRLLVDCARMRASRVTTDTWDMDAGTDVTGSVDATGPGSSSRWLHLTPGMAGIDPYSRSIRITTTATGTTGDSAVEVRARRAYR